MNILEKEADNFKNTCHTLWKAYFEQVKQLYLNPDQEVDISGIMQIAHEHGTDTPEYLMAQAFCMELDGMASLSTARGVMSA